jgi:sugar phosphate isomerase/epimerase
VPSHYSMQLYSARNHPPIDKVIVALGKFGYSQVEGFGGVFGDPEKLRSVMDKNGITMPTGHFSLDMLEKEKKKVLSIATTLGVTKLIAPYLMPDQRPTSTKGWRDFGKRLAAIGETYRAEGYPLGWHNHDFEYAKLKDGTTPHEHIFEAAPLLDWEMDVAWVVRGKADPFKLIKRYANSITTVHIKDIAKKGENLDEDGWADIGAGTVDWPKLMIALKATRCTHFVLEHDKPKDFERFAKRSLAYLKSL